MCSFGSFIGCHGNGSQELIKNKGKMVIFVIYVIHKCNLPPINTPQGISPVIKDFLTLFLINSCQFYLAKIYFCYCYHATVCVCVCGLYSK